MVVEVAFAEWSADRRLRHPAFLGRHADRDPRSVRREPVAEPLDEHRSDPTGARDLPT
jgi:ATP-dependent DNA ligase